MSNTMSVGEFRRATMKTLDVKPVKEAVKATLRQRQRLQLETSIIGTKVAVDDLLHVYNGFLLGFQLNDTMKSKGLECVGNILHHSINITRVMKTKAPPSSRKIKSKSTITMLLTEMQRISGDMLALIYSTYKPAKVEVVEVTRKTRPKDGSEPQERKVQVQRFTMPEIDLVRMVSMNTALLNSVYEFCWLVYNRPAGDVMASHIRQLAPQFPKGFFDAPKAKKNTGGLKPGHKKDQLKAEKIGSLTIHATH